MADEQSEQGNGAAAEPTTRAQRRAAARAAREANGAASAQKPAAATTRAPALEAVAFFEVVAEHDPGNKSAGAPREGEVHLRAVGPVGQVPAALLFPEGTRIVTTLAGLRLGQRFAFRLPMTVVRARRLAGEAPDDGGDE